MKKIISLLAIAMFGLVLSLAFNSIGMSNINSIVLGTTLSLLFTIINSEARRQAKMNGIAYGITFTGPTTFTDEVYQEFLTELIFVNKTVGEGYVRFFDQIKGSGRIRALSATVASQAYSNTPTATGTMAVEERLITPVKREFYDTFDYETIRNTAGANDITPGAANIIQNPFTEAIMGLVGGKSSRSVEADFWNGATSATKTAVAALTAGTAQNAVGAAEKTYVAAAPTSYIDGVLTKLIYSDAVAPGTFAVGTRIKVAGTTLTASNIKDEVDKVYAQFPDELLNNPEAMQHATIFMPMNCKKFIRQYNSNPLAFKDAFMIEGDNFSYLGVMIKFVPLPSNAMIAGNAMDFVWATDLVSDLQNTVVDKLPAPAKNFYYDLIFTLESWVFYQSAKVVYVG
jgi:hypothetical protein